MTDTTPAAIEAILQGAEWQEPENLRRYLFPTFSALAAERDAALTVAAALRKEVERLRGAMAPFDRMAGAMFARNRNKDGVAISFVEKDGPIRLTFADFLAVRAALTAEPLGHGVTADDFGGGGMSEEGFGVAVTLSLALGVALLVVFGQRDMWRSDAISRGYAEYCPLNGAWAWKGECEK